ncbi:MAG: hypothetical protein LBE91_18715 [Tannerella sp.]|nr:hypothetical protein [Tannerella sp.]
MKTDLTDVTFLILVRLDSVERLENTLVITESFVKYFDTNVSVWEAETYNKGLLQNLINRKINYRFIEDKDPVLHKTMYYNQMTKEVKTPYMAIWDTDTVVDEKAITESVIQLREKYDAVYPYNGSFYDIPEIIKRLYVKRKDIQILYRNLHKMRLLYDKILYGGALFVKTEKHLEADGDNETIYGWGNDDFARYEKWKTLEYKIFRTQNPLFHLPHPRGINSKFRSPFASKISMAEMKNLVNSVKEDITGQNR